MNRAISWLRNIGLRQIVSVFLAAITFLAIPAFSYNAQAQTLIAASDNYLIDKDTAEKITKRAEDHVGDRGIGDTGLKNIKNLGENIPETAKEIFRQRFDNDQPGDKGDPNVVKGVQNTGKRSNQG